MARHLVAAAAQIPPGGMLAVEIDGTPIVLFHAADGSIHAYRDRCTHADVALSEGECADNTVTCPAHGAQFDVTSGKALCMPAVKPLKRYPVIREQDRVFVEL